MQCVLCRSRSKYLCYTEEISDPLRFHYKLVFICLAILLHGLKKTSIMTGVLAGFEPEAAEMLTTTP
jgi:hypothetical protein